MGVGDLPDMPVGAAGFARARLVGSVGWAVIFSAFVSWEAVGLLVGHGWLTLSHVTRAVTRSPVGRWVLFGAWLWLGMAPVHPRLAVLPARPARRGPAAGPGRIRPARDAGGVPGARRDPGLGRRQHDALWRPGGRSAARATAGRARRPAARHPAGGGGLLRGAGRLRRAVRAGGRERPVAPAAGRGRRRRGPGLRGGRSRLPGPVASGRGDRSPPTPPPQRALGC